MSLRFLGRPLEPAGWGLDGIFSLHSEECGYFVGLLGSFASLLAVTALGAGDL